ncbi:MAG: thiamine-phosphate kinase, partial [Chitinispirillaceae bacterium]|nr:thiamine-phosphate kinase [Chitinispirillaceae bacterium]
AMVTNVSDCAAMGAVPESALVQLVFPKNSAALHKNIADIYRGFAKACNEWGFKIIGGDLSGGAVWTIGITLIGRAAEKDHILKRKGARSGDILWVSGFPGQSAAGLAAIQKFGRKKAQMLYPELVGSHIRPAARVSLGTKLARCPSVHAGMDLSDGLSKDCRTLCFENRLGLELSFDGLRVPDEMISLSEKLGVPWQEWALHGGEEYELLFATSRQFDLTSFAEKNREIIPIGVFTKIPDELIFIKGSVRTKVAKKSYDHVAIRKNK